MIDRLLVNHPGVYASKGCFERRGGGTRNESRDAFNSYTQCLRRPEVNPMEGEWRQQKQRRILFLQRKSPGREKLTRKRRPLKKRYKEYSRSFVKDFLCFWFYSGIHLLFHFYFLRLSFLGKGSQEKPLTLTSRIYPPKTDFSTDWLMDRRKRQTWNSFQKKQKLIEFTKKIFMEKLMKDTQSVKVTWVGTKQCVNFSFDNNGWLEWETTQSFIQSTLS